MALTAAFLFFSGTAAWAESAAPQAALPAPASQSASSPQQLEACAVIEKAWGNVQLLDSSRTRVVDPVARMPIPCGAWITVQEGWVSLHHKDGQKLRVGNDSFAQFAESGSSDHFLLYRGSMVVESSGLNPEFRILTVQGRARVSQGTALLLYSQDSSQTQLVALEKSASLENRYDYARRTTVRAGEATSLDAQMERTVPSTPKAVTWASLRALLAGYYFPDNTVARWNGNVRARGERKFASKLESKGDRSVASEEKYHYDTHPELKEEGSGESDLKKRLAGGVNPGDHVLYPGRSPASVKRNLKVLVDDVETGKNHPLLRNRKAYNEERSRLIRELEKIGMEE